MKTISRVAKKNPDYFICFFAFTLLLSFYCILVNKPESFLLVNHFYSPSFDEFFTLLTNLGNGLFVLGVMIYLLIRKKIVWSFQIGISFLVSGIFAQILKYLVHSPRPKLFFGANAIHCINGITCTGYTSFPSGHTTTIFALVTLLSLYLPRRRNTIFFFMIAVLTSYSRIYLAQHFPVDVLGGALLGVTTSLMVYMFIPLSKLEKKFYSSAFRLQSIKLQ